MSGRRARSISALVGVALAGAGCSIPSSLAPTLGGSVGLPHSGFLTGAIELPREGAGYRWKSSHDHHWGTPALVGLIEDAAGQLAGARPGSPPVFVGELSAEGGGALFPKHKSHRSGRDVDIMFMADTLEGAPYPHDGFTVFGADGLGVAAGGRFVRFDVDREWQLIRGLVASDKAQVQWIFIARHLEAMLIEHAIARGEPPALIAKAEQVMQQPGDSLPHDDHIHVRIACGADDFARGCDGGGPRWAWLAPPTHVEPDEASLIESLVGDLPGARAVVAH
jgi:penicillin-insensitive murein endopeptidase